MKVKLTRREKAALECRLTASGPTGALLPTCGIDRRMGWPRGTASRTLSRLERRGIVRRDFPGAYRATPEGAALIRQAEEQGHD